VPFAQNSFHPRFDVGERSTDKYNMIRCMCYMYM
jgi:hypothetical protein